MKNVAVIGRDRALTRLLVSSFQVSRVIGNCRPADPGDDLAALAAEGYGIFVLLPEEVRGIPDAGTMERAAATLAGASHVVLVSSAAVNEANAHHPGLAAEDRLTPPRNGNGLAAGWRELEERVRRALDGSETLLTVLRPPAVALRGSRSYWSLLFSGRVAFVPAGFDPTIQVLAGEDLAAAVLRAVESARGETWNVAPARAIPLAKALKKARVLRVPAPYWVQWLLRKVFSPLGAAPAVYLDYLRYSWTVSDEKIRRDLDYRPASTSFQALSALSGEDAGDLGPAYDDFGFDPEYVRRLSRFFFRFLHDAWWRVEWKGLGNVPLQGPAVLTGVHRGFQPWDGVMAMYYLTRELGRTPRFLVHPTLVKFPFLAPYMLKCGGLHASAENAARVLGAGELLAVFPEGIRGAFRKYEGDATYRLGRFGSHEFVRMALCHRAPVVPFVTVGSAEIYPILAKFRWSWWKRWSEWPTFPVTPTMGTIPLPSKWHTLVLEPRHLHRDHPPEAADDRRLVRNLSAGVKRDMQSALDELLERRGSIFFGSIFKNESAAVVEGEA